MKKIIGIILILIACYGIYMFTNYLIFEFRGYDDNGLGSYAVWISGLTGLIIGILFLIIGIRTLKSDKE
ncbi:hypothetical protein [Winogradskyella sp.]|uniref:hypothetical protein n=1 Tax=Winogradskyella sp. TaxID=1883156 RepID=UPI00351272B2